MAAGGRRRSLQMRGGSKVAGTGGADLMKPHGGIGDLVKSGGCIGKPVACGIKTHAGASGCLKSWEIKLHGDWNYK